MIIWQKGLNNVLEYTLALLLILCCNSMIFRSDIIDSGGFSEYYLFITISVIVCIYLALNNPLKLNSKLKRMILFLFSLSLVIFVIQAVIVSMAVATEYFFRFILVFLSLVLYEAVNVYKGTQYVILGKYVKIVTILSLISFILWVFGSLLNILPFSYVNTDWSSGQLGLFLPVKSYFNLMFESQGYATIFGLQLIRNCGIFPEAPMYGFVLVIALALNEFYVKDNSKLVFVILLVTIFSTTSYTAIACAVIVLLMKMIVYLKEIRSNILKLLWLILIVFCIVIGGGILQTLIMEKTVTNIISTNRRASDLVICLQTFVKTTIGCGFYNQPAYTNNLSGSTSGLFRMLGEMGILLGWLPFYFVIKNIKYSPNMVKTAFFLICFLIMYIFTNLPYTPLVLLLFSISFTIGSYNYQKELKK